MSPKRSNTAAPLIPPVLSLTSLREEAAGCRACDLWKSGTQTVFGRGPTRAQIMLVGEQPGDKEDLAGLPFVGPAGKLLDRALEEAGIDRSLVYVTNAVKHFKWTAGERGKRRIHKKPSYSEIQACKPWLEAEIVAIKPKIVVCLGASAAQSVLGRDFKVTQHRGEAIKSDYGATVVPTVHPSSILRAQDEESRHTQFNAFVKDLRKIAVELQSLRSAA